MGRNALLLAPVILLASALPARAANSLGQDPSRPPIEMQFTKGDTRDGSKVRIRLVGDSLHFSRTVYKPGRDAVQSDLSAPMDIRREVVLRRIMGELPRFRVFGSCFGKDMRYYLIDTPEGKFYRSMPERSARCFTDEPDIWPLLEDLDSFIAPPDDEEDPVSAS